MGMVNRICEYQCQYRTNAGYCGRTAGCVKENFITYYPSESGLGKVNIKDFIVPMKEVVRIVKSMDRYILYIGKKEVFSDPDFRNVINELTKYEEENLL